MVMDSPSGQGQVAVPPEKQAQVMTRSRSCKELLEVDGWSLMSLCSQDPSVTTGLCWASDNAGCCLAWVAFSLPLKVSP